ncbi:hypothetical protein K7I13_06000 [Brucepastera parasyntrophica]|nr:hypothetical protein [Brucepastera parasyntrophica]ULQ60816.1 hypothetical protein K7I13_06000 [Brucepastera parasyntrophica]
MLTKILKLCKEGIHGQQGTAVRSGDLIEMTETYECKSALVTIWLYDMPR